MPDYKVLICLKNIANNNLPPVNKNGELVSALNLSLKIAPTKLF